LQFAVHMTKKLFPSGWDKFYQDKCTTITLPITSCAESGRSEGGCRGLDQQARWDRMKFAEYVSESVAPKARGISLVQAVMADGKWRIISIPPRVDNALRPLHHCLYDHLSRQDWCLRGDAKPSRFKRFTTVEGEVFTSGDYESATDNLNSEVQLAILSTVLSQSRHIPPGIVSHALGSYSSLLSPEKRGIANSTNCVEQRRGQLMGQLTSFPLLCLVNYITFKYFIRRDVPVRVNGDDIVFRSTPQEAARWRRGVVVGGLTLSPGKTLQSKRFFSLNSCLFRSARKAPKFVPFVRPKAIWSLKEKQCEKIASLKDRFYSSTVGFGKGRASVFQKLFLVANSDSILRSRRSLTRGLGIKVGREVLEAVGLWHRELFYLEAVDEPPLPFGSFSQYRTNDLPTGWTRVSPRWYPSAVVDGWSRRFTHLTIANAWSRPVLSDSCAEKRWMAECDVGCSPWGLSSWVCPRMRKLLKLSRKQLWRYVCLRRNHSVFGRCGFERGKGCVRPDVVDAVSNVEEKSMPRGDSFHAVPPPAAY
jgi:hypothetical protein